MSYNISLPDGTLVQNIPDEITPEQAKQRIIAKYPEFAPKIPETTFSDNIKEAVKGVVPGIIDLAQGATIGASALFPKETETEIRRIAKNAATTAKAPFTAEPGYENSIGRKFGEALGSTLPFFALGPLGPLGKAAAIGLGIGAGAGEARQNAEQGNATEGQKGLSTALGAAVGATEYMPVLKFLEQLDKPIKKGILEYVQRAFTTGGFEGAQEAAQQVAQNLITQQIYKPDQSLIKDVGESAAYGGAVGTFIQVITDLALKRKGAHVGDNNTETPIEAARRSAEEAARRKVEEAASNTQFLTPEQLNNLATSEAGYGKLEQYKQQLLQQKKSKDQIAAIEEVQQLQHQMNVELINRKIPTTTKYDSAFSDIPQGELFDSKLYTPEQQIKPEETTNPVPQPGQLELPFTDKNGQQVLFPEIGYGSQSIPQQHELPDTAIVVDDTMLDRIGIGPKAAVRKRLLGKRLDRSSNLEYVRNEIETYATKYAKPEQYPAITAFLTNIDAITAKQAELPIRLSKNVEPKSTNTARTAESTISANPVSSISSVGMDNESVTSSTPAEPNTVGMDIPAPITPINNGRTEREYTTLIQQAEANRNALLTKNGRPPAAKTKARTEWDKLGKEIESLRSQLDVIKSTPAEITPAAPAEITPAAPAEITPAAPVPAPAEITPAAPVPAAPAEITPAAPVPAAPVPTGVGFTNIENNIAQATTQGSITRLEDNIHEAKQRLDDLRTIRKDMEKRGNEFLQDNAPEYEQIGVQIANLEYSIKALNTELINRRKTINTEKRTKGRPSVEQTPALSTFPDNPPSVENQIQEILQAVGAYNNPTSDNTRRKLSTDYIFDLAKDSNRPREKRAFPGYAKAAYEFAKRALKYAIDPADLTTPQKIEYDALTKDVTDDNTQWGGYLYQKGTTSNNTPRQQQLDIEIELRTKNNAIDIANWVAQNAPNSIFKLIANKIATRMQAMQNKGVIFEFKIINDPIIANGLGHVQFGKRDNNQVISILLLGTRNNNRNGMNYATILHELVHATIAVAIRGDTNSTLRSRLDEILSLINKRIESGQDITLGETLYKRGLNNMFENIDELVTWALTDSNAQATLEAIPYKTQSIWTRFVDVIRSHLGLSARQNTALSEILSISEQLFDANVNNDIAITQEFAANQIDLVADHEDPSFIKQFLSGLGGEPGVGLRVKLTDQLAGLDNIFTWAYKGAVRAGGYINPMVLLSRALNADRFSNAVQKYGGFIKKNDLWQADELIAPANNPQFASIAGEKISYLKALQEIVTSAKTKGVSVDTEMKRLGNLMVGRRYHELHEAQARGENSFDLSAITPNEAKQANIEFMNDPLAIRVQQMLDAVRFNLVDAMEQSGRIAPETSQSWKNASGYIPFYRLKPEDIDAMVTSRGLNRGLAALKNLRPFKGSDNKVINPIEQFSRLTDWMVSEIMKNEASLKALTEMEMLGKGFATNVAHPNAAPDPKSVITVRDAGESKHFYVPDPANFIAFSLMPAQVSNVVRGFQKLSKVLRAGVTIAPPFVVKQIFDDIYRVYAYSELKHPSAAIRHIIMDMPKNWFNEAFHRNSSYVNEMEKLGIVGSFDFSEIGNVKNIMEEAGAHERGLGGQMLHIMEAGAKAEDFTVRKAIYDQILKETNDLAYAESQAREIINFSRRGSARMIDTLIRTVPFFNAYTRGMDKLWVAASGGLGGKVTGQARATFWRRMSVLTSMGLIYALMMQNDDEYNKLDDHIRDRNWVLPFGKELGSTFVMPLPNELAFIFKAIPERVVQYIRLQGTSEERDTLSILGEIAKQGIDIMATPNLNPQALRWVVENLTNYSFFLGRPLESQSQIANYDPFERYGMGTSETSKAFTSWLADNGFKWLSPIKLDNMLHSIFGTISGIALGISDSFINPTRTDRPIYQQLKSQLTGASAVMKDPIGSRYISMLYDLDNRVTQVNGTYKHKLENSPETAAEYLDNNYGLYAVRPQVDMLTKQLQKLSNEARMIDKIANNLSPAERRDALNLIKLEQQEIARQVMTLETQARQITAEVSKQKKLQ